MTKAELEEELVSLRSQLEEKVNEIEDLKNSSLPLSENKDYEGVLNELKNALKEAEESVTERESRIHELDKAIISKDEKIIELETLLKFSEEESPEKSPTKSEDMANEPSKLEIAIHSALTDKKGKKVTPYTTRKMDTSSIEVRFPKPSIMRKPILEIDGKSVSILEHMQNTFKCGEQERSVPHVLIVISEK